MKLYQKGYEVLCCMKNLCLKRQMGFAILLSDIEGLPLGKVLKGKKKSIRKRIWQDFI